MSDGLRLGGESIYEVVLLALLNRTQRHGPRVGVMVNDHSVAMAVVRRIAGQQPAIEHCALHECEDGESVENVLRRLFGKLGVARAGVFAVASAEDYQLVQVEAPEVQPAELRAAIRWRLRDVINFHIDDAVVDVFQIPDQSRRAQTKMLFAVAARSTSVQRLVTAIAPLARHFDVIDIPELCIRNICSLLPQDQKGVATFVLNDTFAHLTLTRQGVLYLARRIDYGRGYDANATGASNGRQIDAAVLGLELQRSLDYFESHYDQTPIGELVIAPGGVVAEQLAQRLRSETGLRISVLDLRECMSGTEAVGGNLSSECLLALGAALRTEVAAL